jgi:hypothetical protein
MRTMTTQAMNVNPTARGTTSRRTLLLRAGWVMAGAVLGGRMISPLWAEPQIAARIEEAPQAHPLIPAVKMLAETLTEVQKLHDYQATLVKHELVNGAMLSGKMELKFRENPKSVYLKFLEPSAGREVIYWPDRNDGQLLVHEVGLASLVGTVTIDPQGKLALENSRYPVSAIGMRRMVELLLDQWLKETKVPDITVNFYPNAKIGTLACKVIEVAHATQHSETPFQMTRLYLDTTTKLPVRIQNYAFPTRRGGKPELVEDYFYLNLRVNTGLQDIDFDTKNPLYRF